MQHAKIILQQCQSAAEINKWKWIHRCCFIYRMVCACTEYRSYLHHTFFNRYISISSTQHWKLIYDFNQEKSHTWSLLEILNWQNVKYLRLFVTVTTKNQLVFDLFVTLLVTMSVTQQIISIWYFYHSHKNKGKSNNHHLTSL